MHQPYQAAPHKVCLEALLSFLESDLLPRPSLIQITIHRSGVLIRRPPSSILIDSTVGSQHDRPVSCRSCASPPVFAFRQWGVVYSLPAHSTLLSIFGMPFPASIEVKESRIVVRLWSASFAEFQTLRSFSMRSCARCRTGCLASIFGRVLECMSIKVMPPTVLEKLSYL